MEKEPKQENLIEELKQIIGNSVSLIEGDPSQHIDDWFSRFGNKIFQVETYLVSEEVIKSFPAEKYKAAITRMEDLKERLHELRKQYSDKKMPPESIRRELVESLDVF